MPGYDRRTFIEGLAGTLALGGIGTSVAHPSEADDHPEYADTHDIHEHDVTKNADLVGFHTLGGIGSESLSGRPDNPLYGQVTETWLEGDLGFVSIQSSSRPTGNRGVAILDVSAYTRAETRDELDTAEMTVLSFIGNESEAGTGNDVKVSDDGQYLFYSKQAIGWDYGEPASASTEDHDAVGPNVTGMEAYDISDPGDPEYLGNAQGPNIGFHNCFTHRIGGNHYAFGIQGAVPGDAGVHIYRLDENGGGLVPVNFYGGDDVPVTDYGTDAVNYYCHDFYAHDDPVTGKPLGFVAYWNAGVHVIDLSDPTDVELLGVGEMNVGHYAQPVPAEIDGKRLFVGSQEHGTVNDDFSGKVVLFDGDGLVEDSEVTECDQLAEWTLYDNVTYSGYAFTPHNSDITPDGWITQSHQHAGIRFLKIQPPGAGEVDTDEWHIAGKRYDRDNSDDRERIDTDETQTFSGTSGPDAVGNANNYSYHEFTSPLDEDGVVTGTLTWTPEGSELDLYLEQNVSGDPDDPEWEEMDRQESPIGQPKTVSGRVEPGRLYRYKVETDYVVPGQYTIEASYETFGSFPPGEEEEGVVEEGLAYYRSHVEVPPESKTDSDQSPDFWSARIENGVTFGASQHSGLYAIAADPIDVGSRTPVAIDVERRDDGVVFTGGQTNRLVYEVDTDTEVTIRDRLPSSWEVVGGDAHSTRDVGDGTRVVFDEPVGPGEESRHLFVDVGTESGSHQVGPVRYSTEATPSAGGKDWEPVPHTTSTELTGPSQP